MPERPLQLALIGAGRWGRNYLRTIASLAEVRLAAAASGNPQTAALLPPGARMVARWQELVGDPAIDGVIVATPPSSHAEILLAAIAAAKPALVEKPLVSSRAEAAQIRGALAGRRASILVDHIHLFHPGFRALSREIGSAPIRAIEASAGNHGPYRTDEPVLWDWGPHDLAMCLTLVPGPARVAAAACTARQPMGEGLAERLALKLELTGGVPARLALSNMDDKHRWFAVRLDAGTLVFRDFVPDMLTRFAPGADIHGSGGQAIPVAGELPLTRAVLDFAEMIRAGNLDRTSVDLGLAVVELIADIDDRLAGAATP